MRRVTAVDQAMTWLDRQMADCPPHREEACPEDIHPVDFSDACFSNSDLCDPNQLRIDGLSLAR